jgi:putative heme iron utilization protein
VDHAPDHKPTEAVRRLLSEVPTGALGTIDRETGTPYVSLVQVGLMGALDPILFVSSLARHTHNLAADARASLLLDGTGGGDLTKSRVTLVGRIEPAEAAACRQDFLTRHPSAATYFDFPDFAFWRLAWREAHLVAGFGRISTLQRATFATIGETTPTFAAVVRRLAPE